MASVRRLTAILAADVAGYSRLMGADEEGTHERLKGHLGELINLKIAEHRGRIVKNTGDGFLAEFASVVDAVRCAVEVQREMAERNASTPSEKRIEFRIGVNLGDVIAEDHDIFGDGVNVAARLEALAEPGGICVSRVVRDQIRDKLPYAFEDRGEQSVKNIARPVRVYALRPETIAELPVAGAPVAVYRRRRSHSCRTTVAHPPRLRLRPQRRDRTRRRRTCRSTKAEPGRSFFEPRPHASRILGCAEHPRLVRSHLFRRPAQGGNAGGVRRTS